IEQTDFDVFTRRDAHQAMKATFKHPEELDLPLSVLVDRGFIRRRPDAAKAGPGRPGSSTFDVNPLWARYGKSTRASNLDNSEFFEHSETTDGPEEDEP